ncbi:MAG: AEC family transporter [Puniceicoccaceae bacterium]
MLSTLAILYPVFAVIAIGFLLGRSGYFQPTFWTELNRLLFYVCLPALILDSIIRAPQLPSGTWPLILALTLTTLLTISAGFAGARLRGLQRWQYGTFIQGAFRGNLAFVGIPVIQLSFHGQQLSGAEGAVAQAIFVFAPAMIVYNLAAVLLLAGSHQGSAPLTTRSLLWELMKNPLILASIAALLIRGLSTASVPQWTAPLGLVGQIAAPTALLSVGASMAFVSLGGRYKSALLSALLKVVLTPLFAIGIASLVGIQGEALLVLLILSGCPTAAAANVMVKQFKGDEPLSSGTILISTLLAIPTLAIIISYAS